ncbi:NADPH-dependent 7-cyano-7-deazaguanine reductase QueF [bacterium]|nr:NADPH-dependent 7-cyano-7-deazaguanine reductase QueF [bacterium]
MLKTDKIAGTHLGKKSNGSQSYDPSLLVAVPREENRRLYNIDSSNLPFDGWDVWHCYEFSVLTKSNIPVTRVLKLRYKVNSPSIIESKSLKLYLNSFNMSCFGETKIECLEICKSIIEKDLNEKLSTNVEANFLEPNINKIEIFNNFIDIANFIEEDKLTIDEFKESPGLLKVIKNNKTCSNYLKFDSLRSNCRVTHQPDFGDVFIYYKSTKIIDYASLLKYLVSFRSEYHFHEECCEMIFKRINDLLDENDELMVCALYTRRGGIDISPVRWNKNISTNDLQNLIDLNKFARCGIKQ